MNAEVLTVSPHGPGEQGMGWLRSQAELRRRVTCMWCGKPCLSTEVGAHEAECGS